MKWNIIQMFETTNQLLIIINHHEPSFTTNQLLPLVYSFIQQPISAALPQALPVRWATKGARSGRPVAWHDGVRWIIGQNDDHHWVIELELLVSMDWFKGKFTGNPYI